MPLDGGFSCRILATMSPPETFGTRSHNATPNMPTLSVNERALAFAMFNNRNNSITQYSVDPTDGNRVVQSIADNDWSALVSKFKSDPKDAIATARLNILSIQQDTKLPEPDRIARIERYVRAFLDLQVKLDIAAFPNVAVPQSGVPAYVPHGLIDMGSSNSQDPNRRAREMLHVDKRRMFAQTIQNIVKYFSTPNDASSSDAAKLSVIKNVAALVYNSMPYDAASAATYTTTKGVVGVHEAFNERLALCRHHALYTQVMLQALGITSRLFKCDAEIGRGVFEPHAANLARVNGVWYILDATNPDSKEGIGEIFMIPMNVANADPATLNGKEWSSVRNDGRTWRYRPRNDMYYTIQH